MKQRPSIFILLLGFLLLPAFASAAEPQILSPAGETDTDGFGYPIAIDGNVLVTGYSKRDEANAVYVYIRRDGDHANGAAGFREVAKLVPPPGADAATFGRALAIEGDLVIVGAPYEDVGNRFRAGAVYVYERIAQSNQWQFVQRLVPRGSVTDGHFGLVVDAEGDRIVVGAPHTDGVSVDRMGTAFVYERDGANGMWRQSMQVLPSNWSELGHFAADLALSGGTLAIGHPGENAVLLYEYNGWSWVREETIKPPVHTPPYTGVGSRLEMEGGTLVIADTAATRGWGEWLAGAVHVYERQEGNWTRTAELWALEPVTEGRFGNFLDLQDGHLAVGEEIDGSELSVFRRNEAGEWGRIATVPFYDPTAMSGGGKAIAVSENWLAMRTTSDMSKGPGSEVWVYDIDELEAED